MSEIEDYEELPKYWDNHSVNCSICDALIDERECIHTGNENAPYKCYPDCKTSKKG
jgi:hypothetical protein